MAKVMDLYDKSFPWYENRSRDSHMKAMDDNEFYTDVAVDDNGNLLALLFYWIHGNILFGEHVAVNPEVRGQNLGSRLLQKWIADNPGKIVLLEIDPPEDDISIRRLRFYERLGFVMNDIEYTHPSFYTGEKAHPHCLMLLSHGKRLSDSDYAEYEQFMRSTILKYID